MAAAVVEEELMRWWKPRHQIKDIGSEAANELLDRLHKIIPTTSDNNNNNNNNNNNDDDKNDLDVMEPQAKRQKIMPGDIQQLAILIAKECPASLREGFVVHYCVGDNKFGKTLLFQQEREGAALAMEIEECTLPISSIYFGDRAIQANRFGEDEYKEESYTKVHSMLYPVTKLEQALEELFESYSASGSLPPEIPSFDPDFVPAAAKIQIEGIRFPSDPEKGSALVISGESGSGKSWFAKEYLKKKKFPNASFIYYEIGEWNSAEMDSATPRKSDLGTACKAAMHALDDYCQSGTPVYNFISDMSRNNNENRNEKAKEVFYELIRNALKDNKHAKNWWESMTTREKAKQTISELVIIIDEVGKAPNLARGLVDEVRRIYCTIRNQGLAKKVLLVLVGAGIDHFIKDDTPDFAVNTLEDKEFLSSRTDPLKSQVIILKGPDLDNDNRETIFGIPKQDIMLGTYSQVLATNTRMLTRGVIPIYKSELNCLQVDDLSARRIELGSTNIVMDYAARVYIQLNGLRDLEKVGLDALLLQQFGLLLLQELKIADARVCDVSNPARKKLIEFLSKNSEHLQFKRVLRYGLVTSDIQSTTNALRYLACKGDIAPLDAQDGIAFELILQHHLVRLSKVQQHLQAKADGQNNHQPTSDYWCGRYDLVQAWPPSSTRGDQQLSTGELVNKEVETRYSKEKSKNRRKSDVEQIASKVKDKTDFDLVMRQTVSNVQGADVMVLSSRKGEVSLDLYQAKHYSTISSCGSPQTVHAFASLGVKYTPREDSNMPGGVVVDPQHGSAAYSSAGTVRFVEELSKKLETPVAVGKRVIAFSAKWDSFLLAPSWKHFDFHSAAKANVWIWTKEMMAPTLSALTPTPCVPLE